MKNLAAESQHCIHNVHVPFTFFEFPFFMFRHQVERHDSKPVEFEMKVVKSFRDPLSRQVTEAILIKNHQGELLNSKSEFHQPSLIRIHSEIVKGLDD